jgi:hypothetical protein
MPKGAADDAGLVGVGPLLESEWSSHCWLTRKLEVERLTKPAPAAGGSGHGQNEFYGLL